MNAKVRIWLMLPGLALVLSLGCHAKKHAKGFDQQTLTVTIEDTLSAEAKILLPRSVGEKVRFPIPDGLRVKRRKCEVRNVQKESQFHVHYIYFNGQEMPMSKIDSLRSLVLAELDAGASFEDLAERYTMDGNRTGDWGWKSGTHAVKEFSSAVLARSAGDVFLVDVPSNNWYYVVRKDDPDRTIRVYTLLLL